MHKKAGCLSIETRQEIHYPEDRQSKERVPSLSSWGEYKRDKEAEQRVTQAQLASKSSSQKMSKCLGSKYSLILNRKLKGIEHRDNRMNKICMVIQAS